MSLFEIQPPQRDIPQEIANTLLAAMNDEANRRAGIHRDTFHAFWHSTEATPQQIADAMGQQAGLFFAIGYENVQHIGRAAAAVGRELSDYLQPEDYTPPKQVTFNSDGTVTIAE